MPDQTSISHFFPLYFLSENYCYELKLWDTRNWLEASSDSMNYRRNHRPLETQILAPRSASQIRRVWYITGPPMSQLWALQCGAVALNGNFGACQFGRPLKENTDLRYTDARKYELREYGPQTKIRPVFFGGPYFLRSVFPSEVRVFLRSAFSEGIFSEVHISFVRAKIPMIFSRKPKI